VLLKAIKSKSTGFFNKKYQFHPIQEWSYLDQNDSNLVRTVTSSRKVITLVDGNWRIDFLKSWKIIR
jgi:hypothetical protein